MVTFQALTWEARDEDDVHIISIFGRTEDGASVCVSTKFEPFFYVKLKENEGRNGAQVLFNKLKKICPGCLERFAMSQATDVWGFQNGKKSTFIKLFFKSLKSCKYVNSILRRALPDEFRPRKVYESNLEPMLRFMHLTGIKSTGWIDASQSCIQGGYAHTDIDLFCTDWKKLKGVDKDDVAPFVYASLDIECNSSTGKFPDPDIEGDCVFQIAISLIKYGETEPYNKTCLCYKNTDTNLEGSHIINYNTEKELLIGFREFLLRHDVDTITGWNLFGFDMNYIYTRGVVCGCPRSFFNLGKLKDHHSKIVEKNLSSSALGHNELKLLKMPGRFIFDMFFEVKKGYKLDSYKLNSVSKLYLNGEEKIDMPAKEMFARFVEEDPVKLREVAEYCIQDTLLPIKLDKKLCILTNLLEMAKATWVPIDYLSERGQQIKVFSQLAKKAKELGFIIPVIRHGQEPEASYVGATVLEAHKGAYYRPITALDFEGLYPSIMMAHNLCYSSLVMDPKYENITGVEYESFKVGDITYKFAQNVDSLLPSILKELKMFRKQAKRDMAAASGHMKEVYNGKQLAYKVSMNSVYGFTGAGRGMLPCVPIASSVTLMGRSMIDMTKNYVEKNFPGSKVRYGDSVSGDTPIVIRKNGIISCVEIQKLCSKYFTYGDKEYGMTEGLDVWTEKGWTPIERAIRHKTTKKMYRVSTGLGIVDVTEDHSLLDKHATIIKPIDLNIGSELLHADSSKIKYSNIPVDLDTKSIEMMGKYYARGEIDHVSSMILNGPDEYVDHFIFGFFSENIYFEFDSKVKCAEMYLLCRRSKHPMIFYYKNGRYCIEFGNNKNNAKTIKSIEYLGETEQYVYDLTTKSHHFHVGPGEIVVHNTDSVMVEFDVGDRTGEDAIAYSWELGERAANECTKLFKAPNNLELEKVYCPYFLYSKKRYAAKLWTRGKDDKMNMDYIDIKGLQVVRRDNTPYVREVCKELLDVLLSTSDPEPAKALAHQRAVELLDGSVENEKLLLSQQLGDKYKNNNLPHVAVRDKMRERRPGSEPQSGDRIPYLLVDTGDPRAKGYEKSEDPVWVKEHNLPIDYRYYFDKKYLNPICDLIEPLVENPKEDIFGDLIIKKVRGRKKLVPDKNQPSVLDIFKKWELMNSKDDSV